ncbi:MAG: GNAT family N-acetyltransferase [Planctomycetota bacterium]
MDIKFTVNDNITAEEMQLLAKAVGFGRDRSLERNEIALVGSIFVASARCDGKLIGLVRLVGDGGYILHMADLEVHPDFQRRGIAHKLMEMAIDFATDKKIGTGNNLGEFTLFANVSADRFYEKLGFTLCSNGMVLTDTESRKQHELNFQKIWADKHKQNIS